METQEDSIDLSYLKQLALDFVKEPSQISANRLTGSNCWTTPSEKASTGEKNPRSQLANTITGAAKTVDVTLAFPPPPPPSRNGCISMTEGVQSQNGARNAISQAPSGQRSHPSSQSGDTQPISQSVYDTILKRSDLTRSDTQDDTAEVAITQKTLHEGDTGHLDLLAQFDDTGYVDQNDSEPENGNQGSDEIADSPSTHYEPFPESQRFLGHTPASHRHKIDADNGNVTTPSAPWNPFAEETKTPIGLSQLFNATQAPSSSAPQLFRQDLSSDMPSPNIPVQRRFISAALSSPLQMTSSVKRPQCVEPQTGYVSLKESQAAREKMAQYSTSGEPDDNASNDGFENDTMLQHRLRQKLTEDEVGRQFANVTAPERPKSRKGTRRTASLSPTIGHRQLGFAKSGLPIRFQDVAMVGNTHTSNGNTGDSEEETEQEDETCIPRTQGSQRIQSSGEEDKENFDSGPIPALNISTRAHNALSQALYSEESQTIARASRSNGPASPDAHPQSENIRESAGKKANGVRISNSQPDPIQPIDLENDPSIRLQRSNTVPGEVAIEADPVGGSSPPPYRRQAIQSSPPLRPSQFGVEVEPSDKHLDDYNPNIDVEHPASQTSPHRDNPRDLGSPGDLQPHQTPVADGNCGQAGEDFKTYSSIFSRIYETPKQDNQVQGLPHKAVPETSPTAQRSLFRDTQRGAFSEGDNDRTSPNNDDDGLPPMPRRSVIEHRTDLHPADVPKRNMTDPVSAILSSPSGRQRRSMTEIAMDQSPRPAAPDVSLDELGLITAEDKEFQALVSQPEPHPAKRRRINNGRSARASLRTRGTILSNSIPPSAVNSGADTDKSNVTQGRDEQDGSKEPQRASQGSSEAQCVTKTHQITIGQEDSKKQNRRQIAHEVVITPSNSSPTPVKVKSKAKTRESPDPLQTDENGSQKATQSSPQRNNQPIAPNRVLAFFNGRPQGYFPATCVGISSRSGPFRYLIEFDGSDTPDEIEPQNIKRLEMRVDDLVKVDFANLHKGPYHVAGFTDRHEPTTASTPHDDEGEPPLADIYGYKSLIIKPRRSHNTSRRQENGDITVPISSIYFDKSLWSKLGDRPFTYTSRESKSPGDRAKDRRGSEPSMSRISRATSDVEGLFSNMVFAVSSKNGEELRDIEQLITSNGGRLLHDGFDELFEPFVTSGIEPAGDSDELKDIASHKTSIRLHQKAQHIGFVCLITDKPSRTYKFLQALALNLPCLACRWVSDCVSNKRVLHWEHYLLAAGRSDFLNAIRSRNLAPYPPTTACLRETIVPRPKMLAGQSALLITEGGKSVMHSPYVSLIYMLEPERVAHVADLETATDALSDEEFHSRDGGWDWIYIGDESASAPAREALISLSDSPKSARPRGRGRPSKKRTIAETLGNEEIVINNRRVRVLDNESLCQSLILGCMLD